MLLLLGNILNVPPAPVHQPGRTSLPPTWRTRDAQARLLPRSWRIAISTQPRQGSEFASTHSFHSATRSYIGSSPFITVSPAEFSVHRTRGRANAPVSIPRIPDAWPLRCLGEGGHREQLRGTPRLRRQASREARRPGVVVRPRRAIRGRASRARSLAPPWSLHPSALLRGPGSLRSRYPLYQMQGRTRPKQRSDRSWQAISTSM
jgi:hypothetical protein